MELDVVATCTSGMTPLPPPVFTAFECASPTLSHELLLYTGNLPTWFRNAESDLWTDNRTAMLLHMDSVSSDLFFRQEELAIANLRCLHPPRPRGRARDV